MVVEVNGVIDTHAEQENGYDHIKDIQFKAQERYGSHKQDHSQDKRTAYKESGYKVLLVDPK